MDPGIILSTFLLVFVAELGGKSQLISFSLTGSTSSPLRIFLASAAALILSSLIAVLFGYKLAEMLPRRLMKNLPGALFIAAGLFVLVSRFAG